MGPDFGMHGPVSTARPLPFNIEVEQALLGSLFANNQVFDLIAPILKVEDFYEPIHQRAYEVASSLLTSGQAATPFTIKTFLPDEDLGGGITPAVYLARLRTESALPLMARDYAIAIHDLAVRRKIIGAAEEVANQAYDLPVTVKPAQMAGEAIAVLHSIAAEDGARSTRREAHMIAANTINYIGGVLRGEIKKSMVSTGFADLDQATEGYQPGNLWIIGARPAMGKTAYFVTSANKVARRGVGVKGFSLEVAETQVSARMLADLIYDPRHPITYKQIIAADMDDGDLMRLEEGYERLLKMPLVIDVASRLTTAEIRVRVRAEKERMAAKGVKLGVVFIDYLKQIQPGERYKGNRVYEIGEISYSLKQLAKDEGICVVLLAQLNRALEGREDKRPVLSDIRESGDLEADADVVAFIHRESYFIHGSADYRAGNPEAVIRYHQEENQAEIILGKNRAGPTRTVKLWCNVACSTMADQVRGEAA